MSSPVVAALVFVTVSVALDDSLALSVCPPTDVAYVPDPAASVWELPAVEDAVAATSVVASDRHATSNSEVAKSEVRPVYGNVDRGAIRMLLMARSWSRHHRASEATA